MEKIKQIWKDPVWSKVISAGIIGFVILIYNSIYSLVTNTNLKTNIIAFWNSKIILWVVAVIIIVLVVIYTLRKLFNRKEKDDFVYDEKTLELDTAFFNKIRNELLTMQSIYWLRNNNFGGRSFQDELLQPFDMIEMQMERADYDFFNPQLETLLQELMEQIKDFNSFLLPNVFTESVHRLTVPSEWRHEQPERYDEAVDGIHRRAQKLALKYDEFIRKGRKILKVQ
ncbi:hypothetical protein [Flavobacterium sp.]|uniref:hypothetical protein n=1 Tax=Flavobacterium sp. TaxID=239 RepID=UPI0025BC5EDE|nr:hypothetical protein [Flavobacterium sp.]